MLPLFIIVIIVQINWEHPDMPLLKLWTDNVLLQSRQHTQLYGFHSVC